MDMRAGAQASILDSEVMPCAEDTGGERSKEPCSLMCPPYHAKLTASNIFFNKNNMNLLYLLLSILHSATRVTLFKVT